MIEFDTKRLRSNVKIDIMCLDESRLNKIGEFKTNDYEPVSFFPVTEKAVQSDENKPINEMTFKVIISVVRKNSSVNHAGQFKGLHFYKSIFSSQSAPYIMLKDTTVGLSGNNRFEGICIDLIQDLSELYGFKYEFVEWSDESGYGGYNNVTNTWSYVESSKHISHNTYFSYISDFTSYFH